MADDVVDREHLRKQWMAGFDAAMGFRYIRSSRDEVVVEYDVDAIPLPKVATDDGHRDEDFGRAWVEVEAARNPDAILRAIKAGEFSVRFAGARRQRFGSWGR